MDSVYAVNILTFHLYFKFLILGSPWLFNFHYHKQKARWCVSCQLGFAAF